MSTKAKISVEGVDGLIAKLEALPAQARGRAINSAMESAGAVIEKRMRELVPQPGSDGFTPLAGKRKSRQRLVSSIDSRIINYDSNSFTGSLLVVRPNKPIAFHRHLVETGHRLVRGGSVAKKDNGIAPKAKKKSRTGKGAVVGWVKGKEFVKRSFEDTQSQARALIVDGVQSAIREWLSQSGSS